MTWSLTCSEIDNDIYEEDGVWETVEDNPADGEVVVEKGNGDRKYDEVGHEEQQHAEVPVKSEFKFIKSKVNLNFEFSFKEDV